ncbi:conserved metal binding motif protein [Cryptosporidium felis]|nr:conserved metal binding motif protein [Cryptosporidium felis]
MNNALRDFMQCLNELLLKRESLTERYSLGTNLDIDERKKLYSLFSDFEEMKFWVKNVLYGEGNEPFEKIKIPSSELDASKEILRVQLELLDEFQENNEMQVSAVSKRALPRICFLTRETFRDPVSHRYETSDRAENICRNHIFEKDALLKYIGNNKKKACPIAGCNYLVFRKYLKRDQEILDQINNNLVKIESTEVIQDLLEH